MGKNPVTADEVRTWKVADVEKVQKVLAAKHKCACYQCVAKYVNKNGFPK